MPLPDPRQQATQQGCKGDRKNRHQSGGQHGPDDQRMPLPAPYLSYQMDRVCACRLKDGRRSQWKRCGTEDDAPQA